MNILKCPVCAGNMNQQEKILRCENNHCFDIAKEGYVNLLSARKSGDTTGDNKAMASSRRDFLNKGYYEPLAQAVCDCLAHYSDDGGSVLDICCGEGYYTAYCAERLERDFYGFDLSKNMVRLAAKRKCGARFFVANIASIPVRDGAVQAAFHLFAPFHVPEFRRILSDGGVIMTAIPGKHHLFGLKQALYDAPYYNDDCKRSKRSPRRLNLCLSFTKRNNPKCKGPTQCRSLLYLTKKSVFLSLDIGGVEQLVRKV